MSLFCLGRVRENLMERVDVFQQTLLSGHTQIVDESEMLRVLVQADATTVRNYGHVESILTMSVYQKRVTTAS